MRLNVGLLISALAITGKLSSCGSSSDSGSQPATTATPTPTVAPSTPTVDQVISYMGQIQIGASVAAQTASAQSLMTASSYVQVAAGGSTGCTVFDVNVPDKADTWNVLVYVSKGLVVGYSGIDLNRSNTHQDDKAGTICSGASSLRLRRSSAAP